MPGFDQVRPGQGSCLQRFQVTRASSRASRSVCDRSRREIGSFRLTIAWASAWLRNGHANVDGTAKVGGNTAASHRSIRSARWFLSTGPLRSPRRSRPCGGGSLGIMFCRCENKSVTRSWSSGSRKRSRRKRRRSRQRRDSRSARETDGTSGKLRRASTAFAVAGTGARREMAGISTDRRSRTARDDRKPSGGVPERLEPEASQRPSVWRRSAFLTDALPQTALRDLLLGIAPAV